MRLIIDLSTLNKFVMTQSFRMETQKKVRNYIQLNDWAFSLDLSDAYLHVLIHPALRKYLRFSLKGNIFQFRALPWSFNEPICLHPSYDNYSFSPSQERYQSVPYLDDWLSRNQNCCLLLEHRHFIIHLITSLGLIINQENSELIPSQNF